MGKRNLEDLKLGIVEANFTFVSDLQERQRWEERGFTPTDIVPTIGADEGDVSLVGMPLRLVDIQDKYVGREIVGLETYFGTYGMGGAGFLGIQLDCDEAVIPSWIIFCLWCSDRHTRLDALPFQNDEESRGRIIGAKIIAIDFSSECVAFSLIKDEHTMTLAFCYTPDAKKLIVEQLEYEPPLRELVLAIYDGSNLLV
ncbi:hypothetical protein [Leminorella grimontii]|uniref:hypothetical protein n=1 Tax=Leminorella grimontii TaxID=82981 RepID=UPI00322088A7